MRSQQKFKGLFLTTALGAAALLLTACGPSAPQTQPTTTAPGSGSATSAAPSASASASPSAPASTAPASSAPATSDPASPALCKSAGLVAETDASGGGAAGSVFMKLNLTNTGTAPCLLKGFAGVSLTADAAGEPIGAAATRDDSKPEVDILLAPGQTGTAVLRYVQAGNFPDCTPVQAAGFRVYPPEDTASLFLPEPTTACSNTGITLLTIGAFQPA